MMNTKIFALVLSLSVLGQCAVVPVIRVAPRQAAAAQDAAGSNRRGRTLGVLTVGAQALGAGVSAVGSAAAAAVGTAAAAKPLILLGLGKYALWNYLNRPGHSMQLTAGYRAPTYDAGYVVDANDGYFVDDFSSDSGYVTVDSSPSSFPVAGFVDGGTNYNEW